MPQKKNDTTLVTEDQLVDAVTVRVTEQLREDMNLRFGRLEQAIERIAQPEQTEQQPSGATTRKRAAEKDLTSTAPPPKVSKQQDSGLPKEDSLSSIHEYVPLADGNARQPYDVPHQPLRQRSAYPDVSAASAMNVNINNNNPTWNAWRLAHQRPVPTPYASPAYQEDNFYDPGFDSQARHIINATPHQLKGNLIPRDFPYKYVTRGTEKRRLTYNSVTLAEHIFGMFRMIDDERTDPMIKPDILMHMKEVAEDACDFEWQGYVRNWSEEVFSLISENRLPMGWGSTARIQNLRTGMSRVQSARLAQQKETVNPKKYPTANHQSDNLRGGPPCKDFNSGAGCTLQSGHLLHGKRQVHVCSYCLVNTAAAHPHSEAHCRTKQRHAASHF